MSASQHGNVTTTIKQAGSNLTVSKTSAATLMESYMGNYTVVASAMSTYTIYGMHGTYTTLLLTEKKLTRDEGDIGTLNLKYEGLDPASPTTAPPPVYELIRGTSSEPIDTHPDFVSSIGGTVSSPLPVTGPAAFNSDGTFKNFPPNAGNDLGGVQSYLASTMTFKKTYIADSPPSSISAIPKVQDPDDGPFPTLSAPMNWMLMNVAFTRKGGVYEIQKDWMASGKRGWNSLIYP